MTTLISPLNPNHLVSFWYDLVAYRPVISIVDVGSGVCDVPTVVGIYYLAGTIVTSTFPQSSGT